MILHILRHAESEFNLDPNCKKRNCDLSLRGRSQAENINSNFHYDIVYCSPLKRAQETLKLSNINYTKLIILDDLREHKTDVCDFYELEHIDEETIFSLLSRVANVKNIVKSMAGKNILLVGHADFFFYFTAKIVDDEYYGTWLQNAELYTDFDWSCL